MFLGDKWKKEVHGVKYTKDVKVDDIVGNFPNMRKPVQTGDDNDAKEYEELVSGRCTPGWMVAGSIEELTTPLAEEHRRIFPEDGKHK